MFYDALYRIVAIVPAKESCFYRDPNNYKEPMQSEEHRTLEKI